MNAPFPPGAFAGRRKPPLRVAARLALRDLRGGLGGYWIFLLCIALGVAAIAGVGSVSGSLSGGIAREGRVILGGDLAYSSVGEPLGAAEHAYLAAHGRLSEVVTTRAMARAGDGAPALADVKAVDDGYPTAGAVGLEPPGSLAAALGERPGGFGLVADATLVARLGVRIGDVVSLGAKPFVLAAVLKSEPDRLAGGIAFGPRVMVSRAALDASGLVAPGSLARYTTRVALAGPADEAALGRFVADSKAAFPQAGWEIKTRTNVSPEFERNLGHFTEFLTLVGLTALAVGGVGVANAVQAATERKRASLATLKALGASGGTVFAMGLVQVLLLAVLGIVAGDLAGAALPFGAAAAFGDAIPFPLVPAIVPRALALGALYGLLTALVFSMVPLGRAHDIPVSALFRGGVEPGGAPLRRPYRIALVLAVAALVAAAVGLSDDHRLAAWYVAGAALVFLVLRLVALGFTTLARALPRPRGTALRLALANLHRPGTITPAVVLSLGLGLTLLVALALIDTNIRDQATRGRPGVTPSFFFIDIPNAQAQAFDAFITAEASDAVVDSVPMLRGRILALNGVPAEKARPKDGAAWVLEGDRGITYAATPPSGSRLVAGAWWPADYRGPPQVSFDDELAAGLGLKLGDTVTVNVLGRTVTATIANLRKIDWQSFGINFVMVFTPDTFAGAPHMALASVAFPHGDAAREIRLAKDVADRFPMITAVQVKDVLDAVAALVGKLSTATRAASAVTIITSMLVLAGALAAGRRARVHDAVVLKVLGATRGKLTQAFVLEYGILGLATAAFGIGAGAAAAFAVVRYVMQFPFAFDFGAAATAAGVSLAVTVGLGLLGTWRILGRSAGSYLREQT